jgi:hypothetical protein
MVQVFPEAGFAVGLLASARISTSKLKFSIYRQRHLSRRLKE